MRNIFYFLLFVFLLINSRCNQDTNHSEHIDTDQTAENQSNVKQSPANLDSKNPTNNKPINTKQPSVDQKPKKQSNKPTNMKQTPAKQPAKKPATKTKQPPAKPSNIVKTKTVKLKRSTSPASIEVVVNKQYSISAKYVPKDLVYPNVPFIFKEKVEKRKIRKDAAKALEKMFAAAKKDKIYLSGVSGYRSYKTQKSVFNRYVKRDGYEKARTYSALPGTSEHQTGLAIDVSGSTGKCAASPCFEKTKEAAWLEKNSAQYGYIIRYPKGKESITGYRYEPWHLRYVGPISKHIKKNGLTLEEYFNVKAVSK